MNQRSFLSLFVAALFCLCACHALAADTVAEVKNASFTSGEGGGRIIIEATLKGTTDDPAKVIFATAIQHSMRVELDKITHIARVQIEVIQGEPKEIPLGLSGEGEVKQVTGEGLLDGSVRRPAGVVTVTSDLGRPVKSVRSAGMRSSRWRGGWWAPSTSESRGER